MLSVRLPPAVEQDLGAYCAKQGLTKSHVVQEALAHYLVTAKAKEVPALQAEPDLSFLAPDDPIRQFIGIARDGMSTDELMRMTRGDDWNRP